jgi:glycosyltransferase involved in cell wall biosynthesis
MTLRRLKLAALLRRRRLVRAALVRYVRARPGAADRIGSERRITILLSSAWGMGGTIRAVLNMASYLAEAGWEVQILTGYRRRDTPFFGEFPPGLDVTPLDDQRADHAPHGLRGAIYRRLRRAPSILFPREDRLHRDYSLLTDIRLVRHLRRRCGILVGTRPGYNVLIADLGLPGCRTVGFEHMNLGFHKPGIRRQITRAYPKLDALVLLTDRDREAYDELLQGRQRLAVIPNAVTPLRGSPADPAVKVAVAAGRFGLDGQKGIDLLLQAWAPIAKSHPDWRLVIYGEGRARAALTEQRSALGLDGTVEMPGATKDMGGAMGAGSIFVLSSRFEGFPLILLEAMSSGLACVSFDCPTGPADIIDDHRNGLLVPPQDVGALSRAIIEMIEDQDLRRRCAEAGTDTVSAYTLDAIKPRWGSLFSEIAADGRAGIPTSVAHADD